MRAATTTSIPTYPSSPSSGSPVWMPTLNLSASSTAHGSSASARWIWTAARTVRARCECEKCAVTGPVDLVPVARGRRGADDLAHTRAMGRKPLSERVQHPIDPSRSTNRSVTVRPAAHVREGTRGAMRASVGAARPRVYATIRSTAGRTTVRPVFDTLSTGFRALSATFAGAAGSTRSRYRRPCARFVWPCSKPT